MRNILHGLRNSLLGCGVALALAGGAQAGGFTVVHSFAGGSNDGASPLGGVTPAGQGSYYVATDGGGSSNEGTLTLLRKDGTTQVLHTFTGGSDGQNADGAPLKWSIDGNVYGTTQFGGASGCGTIYKYIPGSGAYQQLAAFRCAPDPAFPFAGMVSSVYYGALFGISYNGGLEDDGKLFYVDPDGNTGSSCQFDGVDGSHPFAGVTFLNAVSYGVATAGGANNLGAVTDICASRVLHSFAGGSDGATPYGTLLVHSGVLYGTTANGGPNNLGTVFKISPNGSGYKVLYNFQGICCGAGDGSFPHSGLAFNRKDGMLYGTTINGGNASDLGTIFKINSTTGAETVVHAFNGSDGAHPYGNLYIKKGTIRGTTVAGGASGLGVVFKLGT
ncbi:MAG TPA: choice-of-anchor tandem repeat GloVer-containing protein [Rhizomicrobium sp.]